MPSQVSTCSCRHLQLMRSFDSHSKDTRWHHLTPGQSLSPHTAHDPRIVSRHPLNCLACQHLIFTMTKRCKNRGCTKMAPHPSTFCRTHAHQTMSPTAVQRRPTKKVPAISVPTNSSAPFRNQKTSACCENFSLSSHNQRCFDDIQSAISNGVLEPSQDNKITVGVRCLVPILGKTYEQLKRPLLLLVVADATKVVAFSLKDPVLHAPVLVVAPKTSDRSNAWTKGTLHRN